MVRINCVIACLCLFVSGCDGDATNTSSSCGDQFPCEMRNTTMDAPNGEAPDQWAPVNMSGDAGGGAQDTDTIDATNMGSECTPGERLCTPDNRGVRICDGNGRFLNDTPCIEDEFCDLGECSPQECVPDSRGCVGNIIRVCDEWGSGFLVEQDEDCAASGEISTGCASMQSRQVADKPATPSNV